MKLCKHICFVFIFLFVLSLPAYSLTVKMGSVLPSGSEWDLALNQLADDWRTITNGSVRVKIYPNGIAGTEDNMIRKMRIGQLDMAVLTAIGMNKIVPESFALSLPFLVDDREEVDFMLKEIAPGFDADFREKGFEVLLWSFTGWIRFFTKDAATSPDLLRRHKIGVSSTETEMQDAWKILNFHVIPLEVSDTLTALQSGMIEAFYAPPMAAAAFQWFAMTPHMNEMPVSPLLGGIVISQRTWNRIDGRYHEDLKKAVAEMNAKFSSYSENINEEALSVMKEYGLQIDSVSAEEKDQWENLFDEGYSAIVGPGKLISRSTLEMVKSKLGSFRSER